MVQGVGTFGDERAQGSDLVCEIWCAGELSGVVVAKQTGVGNEISVGQRVYGGEQAHAF
jgi:hypothetical protein